MERLFSDAQFYEFVELVYEAGCDPAKWRRFAEAVQAAVPGSAFHALFDISGTQIAFHSATAGIADEFIASYLGEYGRLNPYNGVFSKLPVGKTFVSEELGPEGWLDKDVFFNEWLLPAGDFTHGAGTIVVRDSQRQLRVTLDLPSRLAHLEPMAQAFLDALRPHLLRAFSVNEKLAASVATANALEVMVARIDGAAVVLDEHSRAIALNDAAQQLCRRGEVLKLNLQGRLTFSQVAASKAYVAAVSAAVSSSLTPAPHAFRLEAGGFEGLAVVLPLRPQSINIAAAAGPKAKALVVIREVGRRTSIPKELCKEAFGLTNAEAELAMRLVGGLTIQEAAADLGVSPITARNQLTASMRKVGVTRQADLIATLLALAPTLTVSG